MKVQTLSHGSGLLSVNASACHLPRQAGFIGPPDQHGGGPLAPSRPTSNQDFGSAIGSGGQAIQGLTPHGIADRGGRYGNSNAPHPRPHQRGACRQLSIARLQRCVSSSPPSTASTPRASRSSVPPSPRHSALLQRS